MAIIIAHTGNIPSCFDRPDIGGWVWLWYKKVKLGILVPFRNSNFMVKVWLWYNTVKLEHFRSIWSVSENHIFPKNYSKVKNVSIIIILLVSFLNQLRLWRQTTELIKVSSVWGKSVSQSFSHWLLTRVS